MSTQKNGLTVNATKQLFLCNVVNKDYVFLSLICIILGMIGGVPFDHPDHVVKRALTAIQSAGNPHFFNYPGLVIYLNALMYGVAYLLMNLVGLVKNPIDFAQHYKNNVLISSPIEISFFTLAHLITIFFGVITVICTYKLVLQLLRRRIFALAAGLILSTAPLWVANSHYPTVDIPLAALTFATILFTMQVTHTSRELTPRQIIGLGIMFGLSTSAKYNGAIVILSILGALFYYYQDHKMWLLHCALLSVVAIITFLITNPFIIFDFRTFINDFIFEVEHSQKGHPGYTSNHAYLFHVQTTLYFSFGWILLIMSVVGLAWFLGTTQFDTRTKLALTLFPLGYYVVIGSSNLAFQRYMLPILPFIAVYAALGLYILYDLLNRHSGLRNSKIIPACIITLLVSSIFPNIEVDIRHDLLLRKQDTRLGLADIISKTDLESKVKRIVVGDYTASAFFRQNPVVLGKLDNESVEMLRFDIYRDNLEMFDQLGTPNMQSVDLLIFDSFSHDGLIYDPRIRRQFTPDVLDNRFVVQISPFTLPKEHIPFSPESLYSPYLPDLHFRNRPGPFIEIYSRDGELAQTIFTACNTPSMSCKFMNSNDGYYYRKLVKK